MTKRELVEKLAAFGDDEPILVPEGAGNLDRFVELQNVHMCPAWRHANGWTVEELGSDEDGPDAHRIILW